jgi:hypothetical protein
MSHEDSMRNRTVRSIAEGIAAVELDLQALHVEWAEK